MQILFITHHYLNTNSGGCYASSAYINAFLENCDKLTLLYPMKKEGAPRFLSDSPRLQKIPIWYNKPKIVKFIDLLCGKVHRYSNIRKYIKDASFDIVVFDTSLVSFHLIYYFRKRGSKIICIHHNYQYEYFRDNTHGLIRIPVLYWCKRYEREAVRKSDINLTLTPQDETLLRQAYGKGLEKFNTIGVFEYQRQMPKEICTDSKLPTFVITGGLDAYQTKESLKQWLLTFYCKLKDVYPNHRLIIAGRNPDGQLLDLCHNYPQIEVMANPVNMDEVLVKGNFYLCPTFLGGGLKLRIMDGLSHGMPVITHAVSARGYEAFREKRFLFSYETPEQFRECLYELSHRDFDHKEIRNFYESTCSFDKGAERVKKILSLM